MLHKVGLLIKTFKRNGHFQASFIYEELLIDVMTWNVTTKILMTDNDGDLFPSQLPIHTITDVHVNRCLNPLCTFSVFVRETDRFEAVCARSAELFISFFFHLKREQVFSSSKKIKERMSVAFSLPGQQMDKREDWNPEQKS